MGLNQLTLYHRHHRLRAASLPHAWLLLLLLLDPTSSSILCISINFDLFQPQPQHPPVLWMACAGGLGMGTGVSRPMGAVEHTPRPGRLVLSDRCSMQAKVPQAPARGQGLNCVIKTRGLGAPRALQY
jgi:hypothetical protein